MSAIKPSTPNSHANPWIFFTFLMNPLKKVKKSGPFDQPNISLVSLMQNNILLSVILLIWIKSHVLVRDWQTVRSSWDSLLCTEGKNLHLMSLRDANCPAVTWIPWSPKIDVLLIPMSLQSVSCSTFPSTEVRSCIRCASVLSSPLSIIHIVHCVPIDFPRKVNSDEADN